jgi:P pilus assembly chaperone PapD
MTNGSVTLNGVTDKQLVAVLEAKIHHEGKVFFNPQQVQQVPAQQPNPEGKTLNNNVVVSWHNEEGFKAAIELQARLAGHKVVAIEEVA